jgi:hypothetical protein
MKRLAFLQHRYWVAPVVALAIAATSASRVSAQDPYTTEAASIRQAACQELQPEFDRITKAHSGDPGIKAVLDRLTLLDQASGAVLRDLRLRQSAFINQSLATVGESNAHDKANQPIGAIKIIETYQSPIARPLNFSGLSASDRQTVDTYQATALQAQESRIESRAHVCLSTMGIDSAEIIRLAFIVPLLASQPSQDLSTAAPALPSWMTRPQALRMLEDLSLQYGRPRLAFALARRASAATMPSEGLEAGYLAFVNISADAMLRNTQYGAALACLRDGVAVAKNAKLDKEQVALSFRIAEVVEVTDSAKAAAQQMSSLQLICSNPDDYGRAAMLKLKYLYEAQAFDGIPQEATTDVKDSRCASYLPQIMYIAWVTCRRQQGADAESWRKSFLQKFPDNPLGADMYFAAAMDSLASGQYSEASRLLKFIEYRFPNSKIIDKVREIRQRLDAVNQGSPATQPASAPGAG